MCLPFAYIKSFENTFSIDEVSAQIYHMVSVSLQAEKTSKYDSIIVIAISYH